MQLKQVRQGQSQQIESIPPHEATLAVYHPAAAISLQIFDFSFWCNAFGGPRCYSLLTILDIPILHPMAQEQTAITAEHQLLLEAKQRTAPCQLWGPYLSERQSGTVRENSSANGHAWGDQTYDHASSRACLWGEDGRAGFSDVQS